MRRASDYRAQGERVVLALHAKVELYNMIWVRSMLLAPWDFKSLRSLLVLSVSSKLYNYLHVTYRKVAISYMIIWTPTLDLDPLLPWG